VELDKSKINSSSIDYLDNLPGIIEKYINNYDWVDDQFQEEERIKFTIQIILQSVDNNYNFKANIIISSKRPIYNSLQQTPLVIINDNNWQFNYPPNKSLTHDERQYDDIATVLDYYCYIVLGYDYDSFSELGGTPYFTKAQNLVDLAQTTSAAGWSRSSNNRRNRYYLVSDLLNTGYEGLRKAIYRYHRYGLDQFIDKPKQSRQEVLTALKTILEAKRRTTNVYLFDLFFNSKYREIVAIFQDAETQTRLEAYNLLSDLDPGHMSEYNQLQ